MKIALDKSMTVCQKVLNNVYKQAEESKLLNGDSTYELYVNNFSMDNIHGYSMIYNDFEHKSTSAFWLYVDKTTRDILVAVGSDKDIDFDTLLPNNDKVLKEARLFPLDDEQQAIDYLYAKICLLPKQKLRNDHPELFFSNKKIEDITEEDIETISFDDIEML